MSKMNRWGWVAMAGAFGVVSSAQAWESVYLDDSFATQPPEITVYVDVVTGNVKLVGEPGAVMNQYRITSSSGALLMAKWTGVDKTVTNLKNSGVDLTGTTFEEYRYWMPMYMSPTKYSLGDKCCPLSDPELKGVIQFDLLPNHTLDLGNIWSSVIAGGNQADLTFVYSYGYVRESYEGELSAYMGNNLNLSNDYGETGDGQVTGNATFPKPDASFVPGIMADVFPEGDGVSAIARIVYVPEGCTLGVLGMGVMMMFGRRIRDLP